MPLPLAEIAPAIDPTIVTSSPSRIHTVPSPIRIFQCHRDHGSRSSRAGMLVSIVPSSPADDAIVAICRYLLAFLFPQTSYPAAGGVKQAALGTPLATI